MVSPINQSQSNVCLYSLNILPHTTLFPILPTSLIIHWQTEIFLTWSYRHFVTLCFWSRGNARCRPEGHFAFFNVEVYQDFCTDSTAALQPKPFGFGVSSRQKLHNSFCEALLLSLQTQRGKCRFIERLHTHTCTVKVLLLWLHLHFRFFSPFISNMYVTC